MASLRPLRPSFVRTSQFTVRSTAIRPRGLLQKRVGSRAAHSTHATTQVSRQWFTRGRVLSFITYSTICYFGFKYILGRFVDVGVDVELRVGDDAGQDARDPDQESDDDDFEDEDGTFTLDDEDASFVSLQFPKKLPQSFYKSSDPEWKEFVKLSGDKDRQEAVRKDLAERVVKAALSNPRLAAKLGEEVKWTKLWLDLTYPEGPAPEYTRQGIIVLEDELALTTQVMPHAEYQQLTSILYPWAVMTAMKNSLHLFYVMQKIRVKELFGQTLNEKERRTNLALKIAKMRLDVEDGDDSSPHVQAKVTDSKAEKLGPPDAASSTGKQPPAPMFGLNETLERAKSLPMAVDATIVSKLFMTSLAHNWPRGKLDKHPPGCCYLHGDVELVGKRGRAKVSTIAAYDPKAAKIVWMQVNAAHVWSRQQSARGGP